MASVCGRHWPTDWPRRAPSSLEPDWGESSSVVSRLGPRGGVLDDVMAAMESRRKLCKKVLQKLCREELLQACEQYQFRHDATRFLSENLLLSAARPSEARNVGRRLVFWYRIVSFFSK